MYSVSFILSFTVAVFIYSSWIEVNGCAFERIFEQEWESFKVTHKKTYKNDVEETFRKKIYMDNRRRIADHNKSNSTYKQEINHFGDMLFHELSYLYTGLTIDKNIHEKTVNASATFIPPANVQIPKEVDWRDAGAVTPVKNQGQCGSCWSFAVTGALEGQIFRKTGKLVSMSEQQLVDCASSRYYCYGCNGGYPFGAYNYIRDNGGIDSEGSYPYAGKRHWTCGYSSSNEVATDQGSVLIKSGSERKLQQAVATHGPVVVSIQVIQSFYSYQEGVYYDPSCQSGMEYGNHAVLVVGYGQEDGNDYWLVKNSWGEEWGENGYVKMARNVNNNCGIATTAGYPLV